MVWELIEPWALVPLLASVTSFVVAWVIFANRPDALQNRALAMFLWTNAAGWALLFGLGGFAFPRSFAGGGFPATYFIWSFTLIAYVWLLSTLETPWVGWLRVPALRWSVTVLFGVHALLMLHRPFVQFSVGLVSQVLVFDLVWVLFMAYGIVAATSAWRRAKEPLTRRKNAAFALAFITHDAGMILFLVVAWLPVFLGRPFLLILPPALYSALPGFMGLALQGLLLYGVLSTQLFDMDLKLRWGISKGAMASIFFAVFFAVSEIVSGLLSDRMGVFAGVSLTALLLLAASPLQGVANRFSALVVRGAEDSPAYRAERKEMVYRAQLEELLADGVVTAKERMALLRLQETLEIDGNLASRIEREMLETMR